LLGTQLLCPVGLAAFAQEPQIETMVVRNRPADDLVPVLQPFVGPAGAVTASGSRLIVKAAPDRRAAA
jgi:hypothetical protein